MSAYRGDSFSSPNKKASSAGLFFFGTPVVQETGLERIASPISSGTLAWGRSVSASVAVVGAPGARKNSTDTEILAICLPHIVSESPEDRRRSYGRFLPRAKAIRSEKSCKSVQVGTSEWDRERSCWTRDAKEEFASCCGVNLVAERLRGPRALGRGLSVEWVRVSATG